MSIVQPPISYRLEASRVAPGPACPRRVRAEVPSWRIVAASVALPNRAAMRAPAIRPSASVRASSAPTRWVDSSPPMKPATLTLAPAYSMPPSRPEVAMSAPAPPPAPPPSARQPPSAWAKPLQPGIGARSPLVRSASATSSACSSPMRLAVA